MCRRRRFSSSLMRTLLCLATLIAPANCFILGRIPGRGHALHTQMMTPCPSTLPGDPSLVMSVSVKLQDKAGFVKAASAAVAEALSKPESYVAIVVTDDHDGMSFGGTTDPCAVGCVYSIGAINQDNNGALTAKISALLEEHGGVPNNRIYINFFDVPRANWYHLLRQSNSSIRRQSFPAVFAAEQWTLFELSRCRQWMVGPDLCGLNHKMPKYVSQEVRGHWPSLECVRHRGPALGAKKLRLNKDER